MSGPQGNHSGWQAQPPSWQQPRAYNTPQPSYAPTPGYAPPPSYGHPIYTPGPHQAMVPHPGGYPVTRKEPAIALLVSFFLPGVGTIMNGETSKGVGILVGYIVCILFFWLMIPIVGIFALWIWGMVDAYQGAQNFNRMHGLP